MRFDSWGDYVNIHYRWILADDHGRAPDLQDCHSAVSSETGREKQANILIAIRVSWSHVLYHALHLIKQLILLQKDFRLWITQWVTDITWFPRQHQLSLHSPRRSRLMLRYWRTPPDTFKLLQSDICVPIFTWCSLIKKKKWKLKMFENRWHSYGSEQIPVRLQTWSTPLTITE